MSDDIEYIFNLNTVKTVKLTSSFVTRSSASTAAYMLPGCMPPGLMVLLLTVTLRSLVSSLMTVCGTGFGLLPLGSSGANFLTLKLGM